MARFTSIALAMASAIGYAFASSGDMTYYAPGLGACGIVNNESDAVVALSYLQYSGADPCGRTIDITLNGKTVSVTVVDKCMGCVEDAIDVSPSVFELLASLDVGRTVVEWDFTS
ncbi:Allergen Asp f 7-like protein [Seiridium cupressi]